MCVYIEPDGAVCECVKFNHYTISINHYNNFLTDTPRIRPEKRGIS